jgi:galactokinase
MSHFQTVFGRDPEATASAPGRVNLLGEHTDYNDGYVLPIAIPQQTHVAIARAGGPCTRVHAHDLGESAQFTLDQAPADQFARYVYGCLRQADDHGCDVPPLDIFVSSDVPMGVGLSSSAALEVAVLRALRTLLDAPFDDVRIAQLAQAAEIEHAGVHCGIMDQMASSLADSTQALFLDTRTLHRQLVPLPAGSAVLVIDSGIARALAGSQYNERRAECEQAAKGLGLNALRDTTDVAEAEALPEPLNRRARHVISENNRVLAALQGLDATAFGVLMNASHASLRDDYEVSVPPLDALVDLLQRQPGVHGARLTGAGFGGACVALCEPQAMLSVGAQVLAAYAAMGQRGRVLVPA